MEFSPPPLPEKFALLLFTISSDAELLRWFCSLRRLSTVDRDAELGTLTRRWSESGRDPQIIDALFHLMQSGQYDVAYQALIELREEEQAKKI